MAYHHYAELIAFLAGCLLLNSKWPAHFKWLVALVGLTFVVEIAGHILWTRYRMYNNWLYNLYLPIQCLAFLLFFIKSSTHQVIIKVQKSLLWLMLAGTIITWILHRNFWLLNSHGSTVYLFLMLVASCLFFVDAVVNNVEVRLVKQAPFWVAAGLLFFTVVFILFFALWLVNFTVPYYNTVFSYSVIAANTFLYGGLIASFICLHLTKNYSMHSS